MTLKIEGAAYRSAIQGGSGTVIRAKQGKFKKQIPPEKIRIPISGVFKGGNEGCEKRVGIHGVFYLRVLYFR